VTTSKSQLNGNGTILCVILLPTQKMCVTASMTL